jgi:hypothetical protein
MVRAGALPASPERSRSLLALGSPETAELPTIVNFLEARGVAFRVLDEADQLRFLEPRVVLDAKLSCMFSNLS